MSEVYNSGRRSAEVNSGTTAQRSIQFPSPIGDERWDNTTLGYREYYNAASAQWEKDQVIIGGGVSVASAPMESGPIYADATYQYFAMAVVSNPASALSDAVWQVSRMHSTSKRVEYATGASFSHAYTDLSAAQAAFA